MDPDDFPLILAMVVSLGFAIAVLAGIFLG